ETRRVEEIDEARQVVLTEFLHRERHRGAGHRGRIVAGAGLERGQFRRVSGPREPFGRSTADEVVLVVQAALEDRDARWMCDARQGIERGPRALPLVVVLELLGERRDR